MTRKLPKTLLKNSLYQDQFHLNLQFSLNFQLNLNEILEFNVTETDPKQI